MQQQTPDEIQTRQHAHRPLPSFVVKERLPGFPSQNPNTKPVPALPAEHLSREDGALMTQGQRGSRAKAQGFHGPANRGQHAEADRIVCDKLSAQVRRTQKIDP
jgi:hypothetical protein